LFGRTARDRALAVFLFKILFTAHKRETIFLILLEFTSIINKLNKNFINYLPPPRHPAGDTPPQAGGDKKQ